MYHKWVLYHQARFLILLVAENTLVWFWFY